LRSPSNGVPGRLTRSFDAGEDKFLQIKQKFAALERNRIVTQSVGTKPGENERNERAARRRLYS